MEKMNKEVKGAVKELLEKIPEDKLSEAVGGLSQSAKNALYAAGLLIVGTGLGIGGTLAGQKLFGKNNKLEKTANNLDPAKDPAPTGTAAATEAQAAAAGAKTDPLKIKVKIKEEGKEDETEEGEKNPGGETKEESK